MKKLMILLAIIFIFSCFSGLVAAEGIDLTTMDDEELLILRDKLNNEIHDRNIDEFYDFYGGIYTAGVDIKAGSYNLEMYDCDHGTIIRIYDNEESYRNGDSITNDTIRGNGWYHFTLTDGMVVDVHPVGKCSMRLSNEKPVWAP